MYRNGFFLMGLLVYAAGVFAQQTDSRIVETILEKCGLPDIAVESVAVMENGRVTKLDLSNKDVSKDGISVLPAEIGLLTELQELTCTDNVITAIPAEIGSCVNLTKFNAASNRITALVPEIGKLKNLTHLDLRHNSIEKLPPEIGDCSNLEFLWLWGNKLTELDPAITKLRKLQELYLKDNRLTTLPIGIVGMRFQYIDLLGNRLCNLSSVLDVWARKIDDKYKSTQRCN